MRKLLLVIFLTLFGLGIGIVVGAIVMRRVDRAAARVSPRAMSQRAGDATSAWRRRLRTAIAAGAAAATEKEAELRHRYGVLTVDEARTLHRSGEH
ncbi:MAG: hypothetical protein KY462_11320 [Actinobacteria bacterium]|nr:hypothetical protein [Actinomycetota bacterium]